MNQIGEDLRRSMTALTRVEMIAVCRRSWLTLAFLSVGLAGSGCSSDDEPVKVERSAIHLIGELSTATGDPGLIVEDGTIRVRGGEVIVDGAVGSLPEARTASFEGNWVRETLHAPSGAGEVAAHCTMHWFEAKGASLFVELMTGELAPGEDAFVVEVFDSPDRWNFGDPIYMRDLLRRSDARRLFPDGASTTRRAGVINTSPSCRRVLFILRSSPESAKDARLRVRRQDRTEAWVRGAPGVDPKQPLARLIEHQSITRESIMLGVPGELTFRMEIPALDPVLELAVMTKGLGRGAQVTLEVRADAGNGELQQEAPVEASSWRDPLSFDLTAVAGKTAELTLSLKAKGRGRVFGAIGAPTIRSRWEDPPFDLVVISIDTVRADHTSLAEYSRPTTPHLEALAKEAVVFDHAVSGAPWTLPSHTTLFSGLLPDRHGVVRGAHRIPDEVPLLAEDLREQGYRTIAYTGGGNVAAEFGFGRGFDRYGARDPAFPPLAWALGAKHAEGGHKSLAEASEKERSGLIEQLESKDGGPRFIFAHTYVAHEYRSTEAALLAVGAPKRLAKLYSSEYSIGRLRDIYHAGKEAESREATEWIYDATVWLADELVGDVVDALRRSGRLDRTVLVVVSDHGEELFERGVLGHGHSAYEELSHVPLVMRVPGVSASRVSDVVSLADVAPTLRDLLGVGDAHQEDGRSLRGLLQGERMEVRPAMTRGAKRGRLFRSLRGSKMKIHVERAPDEEEVERLYDLRADPNERNDLTPTRPKQSNDLASSLRKLTEGLQARAAVSSDAELSPELREQLKQLGYLGDAGE